MSEWLTYSLHDLLIFSPDSYFALFEIYNRQLWPWNVIAVLLALAGFSLLSQRKIFIQAGMLSLSIIWLFIGMVFMQRYYAQINTLAHGLSWLFIMQSLLMILVVLMPACCNVDTVSQRCKSGYLFLLAGLVVFPLLPWWMQRSWQSVEIIGIAPDPTALMTLGLILLSRVGLKVWLLVIPIIWLIVSTLTYMAMTLET